MSIKFLLLGGGGVFWVLGEGGECRFYLYGREDFSERLFSREMPRNKVQQSENKSRSEKF